MGYIIKCSKCGRVKENYAKRLCKLCYNNIHRNKKYKYVPKDLAKYKEKQREYYHLNKERIDRMDRDRNLKKQFGFAPELAHYRVGDITSAGCSYGNSCCIGSCHIWRENSSKLMHLYSIKSAPSSEYVIQIYNAATREEFLIEVRIGENKLRSFGDVLEFFEKLKRYPIDAMVYWKRKLYKQVGNT